MKNYTYILNEGFNSYFNKLEESQITEIEKIEKEPVFEFPNGEYYYVNVDKENNTIYAGSATNNGIIKEFEIDYDVDDTLDGNLSKLYDYIVETKPELMDEPLEESKNIFKAKPYGGDKNNFYYFYVGPGYEHNSIENIIAFAKENFDSCKDKSPEEIEAKHMFWGTDGIGFEGFYNGDTFILFDDINKLPETIKQDALRHCKGYKKSLVKEALEKFIITKIGDNKYALAQGNPPVINARKTINASSPEEAKEILKKYGYSENELIIESCEKDYLKESIDRKTLINAVKDAYGFTTKEALDWLKKASEDAKAEIVKGFKSDANKALLND